jgi:hypothetical protein
MLILTVVLFAVATAAAWWRLAPLHPAQLWLTVWLIALALFSLRLLPYKPLADETLVLIGSASLAFVSATVVADRFVRARLARWRIETQQVEWAAAALLCMALLGCALFVAQAVWAAGIRDALFTSPAVRVSVRDGGYALTIKYLYFALAAAAMCGVAAGVVPARRRRWLAYAGVAVACTYFATGRATVVVAGLAALIAYVVAAGERLSLRRVLLGVTAIGILSLTVFSGMGTLIGKTYENHDLVTVRSFFSEHPRARGLATPYMYMSAPIGALNVLVLNPPAYRSDGCAMLSAVCSGLARAGFDTRPVRPIRPFTAEPIPWNTYTALDDGIRDVGAIGVPAVFALVGALCGWLWACARIGRLWAVATYALLSTAIITSAGANTFAAAHVLGAVTIMLVSLAAAMLLRTRVPRR